MANGIVVGFVLSQLLVAVIPVSPQVMLPPAGPGEGLMMRLSSVAIALGYSLPVAPGGYGIGYLAYRTVLVGRRRAWRR